MNSTPVCRGYMILRWPIMLQIELAQLQYQIHALKRSFKFYCLYVCFKVVRDSQIYCSYENQVQFWGACLLGFDSLLKFFVTDWAVIKKFK